MKTLVFLLTFWSPVGGPPVVEVAGHGLTGEECVALLLAYEGPATPSCEIDQGE